MVRNSFSYKLLCNKTHMRRRKKTGNNWHRSMWSRGSELELISKAFYFCFFLDYIQNDLIHDLCLSFFQQTGVQQLVPNYHNHIIL